MVKGQWLMVNGQRSKVNCQLSIVNYQLKKGERRKNQSDNSSKAQFKYCPWDGVHFHSRGRYLYGPHEG